MLSNPTQNYLLTQRRHVLLAFSGAVTTAPTYLKGAGGEAGDGFPSTQTGAAVKLAVWDGLTLHSAEETVSLAAGDRLSLHFSPGTSEGEVTLRLNGVDTALKTPGVLHNAVLFAVLHLILME